MNVSNILKVADAIEQASVPGLGFNMGGWKVSADKAHPDLSGHSCGTVACIAGWTCEINGIPMRADCAFSNYQLSDNAAAILGLTEEQREELFTPEHEAVNYHGGMIGPVEAVRCLRNLTITGKVDWAAAMKPDEPVLPPLPPSRSLTRATTGA
jgi:hypothetical protein